jgi:putative peptidoglycan lipid II flippase
VAVTLGATAAADAMLLSLTLLTMFDVVFVSGAAILAAQALYIRRNVQASGRTALTGFARSAALWAWAGLAFGAGSAVGAEPLALLIAPGFSPEARALFADCCLIASLLPTISSLMVFASALNRINGAEILYTVNPLAINGASWLAIILGSSLGLTTLGIIRLFLITVVATTALMLMVQLILMGAPLRAKLIAHFLRAVAPRRLVQQLAAHAREMRTVGPIIAGLLVQQVMTLISYGFVTRAGSGYLLLFGLAERLINVIFAVFIMTFLTVLEPRWARASVAPGGSREIIDDVTAICATLLPLTATLMFAGDGLATALFAHGAVSDRDIGELSGITLIYALTLPGLSMGVILTRLLVIRGRTGRIFVVNAAVTVAHLVLCALLFDKAGVRGVAIALAISLFLQTAAYAWLLTRNSSVRSEHLHRAVRLFGLAVVVTLSAWLSSRLELTPVLRLVAVGAITLLVTLIAAPVVGLKLWGSIRRLASL